MARLARDLQFDSPYDEVLSGLLSFKRFSDAERTIRILEGLRQKYLAEQDKKGLAYCRQIALAGRKRAELISRNRKISPARRKHKKEIAYWFQIWLETPDIFEAWLALRKSASEYMELATLEEPGRPE